VGHTPEAGAAMTLTETQRACIASEIANMKHGDFHGNQHKSVSANLQIPPVSQSSAAEMFNVSPRRCQIIDT
jgi:hypothetical protein